MYKGLFVFCLLLLCIGFNLQIKAASENYAVAEKNLLKEQKELFYQTIVEMHKNGQMTKENLDALIQKLEIKEPKKILIYRKNQLERKSMVFYTIKLLGCGAAVFYGVGGIVFSVGLGMSGKVSDFMRWCNPGDEISDAGCYFIYVSSIVCYVLLARYGVRGWKRLFADERERLQQIFIVEEIIKELDRMQIA